MAKRKTTRRKPASGKIPAPHLPARKSAASPDPLVGLSINPGLRSVVLPSAEELGDLGSRWIRYLIVRKYQDFQTGQNSELDAVLRRYKNLDVQLLVLINTETFDEFPPQHGSPDWVRPEMGYISQVAELAQKLAAFYRGKIHAIEILNEPEGQGITPEDYGRLLKTCYAKIKAVSDVPVISGGICCGEKFDYLQRVAQSSGGAFDAAGWHVLGLGVGDFPFPNWKYGELRDSLARARALAGKPLWLTEFGADLNFTWPDNLTREDAVAEYLRRGFDVIRAVGANTVARAFWFTWKFPRGGWGLVDDSGKRRPAWFAFQKAARVPPPYDIALTTFTPALLDSGEVLNVSITVKNNSNATLQTQGPAPDFVYEEGDTFYTRGFPDVNNAFRVGIDFDGRTGIDHPYRWGLGAPLPPGQSATITGGIRLTTVRARDYWTGLVREQIAWVQDRQGARTIAVNALPEPMPQIVQVKLTPTILNSGDRLNVSITVKNNSDQPLPTQGPDPGFVYEEGDTFYTRGFPDVLDAYRVGIDFTGRTGWDHPYRWGFGAPLAPGETRTITGAIRLRHTQFVDYWAGLVRERIAWLQDHKGIQRVAVRAPADALPQILAVTFSPATLHSGDLVQVSVTIKNNSNGPLETQGPEPGFVYEEGDTFYSRGFRDEIYMYRVGVEFGNRTGIDHPYRWGLGEPLLPGRTVTVTGAIRLKTVQAINYWVGLVQEQIKWWQDREGSQFIIVNPK
jgi:hypothetical protein